jgi:hypothetical protein
MTLKAADMTLPRHDRFTGLGARIAALMHS